MKAKRRRGDMVLACVLECGHTGFVQTGRKTVRRATAAVLLGEAVRRGHGGIWCEACSATCAVRRYAGTARQ